MSETGPRNANHDRALRPRTLKDFLGQSSLREDLRIYIDGARARGEALDHVLLYGPPGLGKTTLAEIIASEMGVPFTSLAAPSINRVGDLASVLVSLEPRSVLFIDEIHRLPIFVEESLYTAMEDYKLEVIVGEGGDGRAVTLPINPFTLVGATTRKGMLSLPLLDRFAISMQLRYYTPEELAEIVSVNATKLGMKLEEEAVMEIARRARGTPRVAGTILRRVRDFATAYGESPVSVAVVDQALARVGIDPHGLTDLDRRYLECLRDTFGGGPVGINTLAATLSEDRETLEVLVEPFLLQKGMLKRTSRGRVLGDADFGSGKVT